MMTTMLQRHAAGRARILLYVVFSAGVLTVSACGGNLLSRKYEYEEDIYLDLDGSATVYVSLELRDIWEHLRQL